MQNQDFNTKVFDMYEGLLSGNITCENANEFVKSNDFQRAVQYYKDYQLQGKGQLNEEEMFGLLHIINVLQYIYNNGTVEVGVDDFDYDVIYELLENSGESVVTVPINSSSRMTRHHKYTDLRGSLTKVYYLTTDRKRENPSRKYLDEWITAREKEILDKTGRYISLNDEDIYVFPKWDGISGIFECDGYDIEEALTRGYTKTNEACSILHIVKNVNLKSHIHGKHGIKTEIMVREEGLEEYNKKYGTDYKQTRSIASSIINSNVADERVKYLVIQELRIQDENGNQRIADDAFNQPYIKCKLSERDKIEKFAQSVRYVDGLRCDGAVIYIINPEIQKILGREDEKNKYEVAYKFTEEVGYSTIKDIIFNIGLFGKIAPVAEIKPIKLKGNTISNISLGSYGRFKELGLSKDDQVAVHYDIIPYLLVDDNCVASEKKKIKAPTHCPICGHKLIESETGYTLSCKNDSCECRIKGKILNFIQTMQIEQISEGRLCKLYDLGFIKSIPHLYKLKSHRDEIASIKGFGETMIDNIINQIDAHRTQYADIVLGSLGIEGIKDKTFETILNEISFSELIAAAKDGDVDKLCEIRGIKNKKAMKIIVGLNDNLSLLEFLDKELNMVIKEKREREPDFTVCFTKIRDKELEKFIEEHNGEVVSMNKKISMLIVPDSSTTGAKIDICKEVGIPIVPIADAKSYILSKYN